MIQLRILYGSTVVGYTEPELDVIDNINLRITVSWYLIISTFFTRHRVLFGPSLVYDSFINDYLIFLSQHKTHGLIGIRRTSYENFNYTVKDPYHVTSSIKKSHNFDIIFY